MWPFLWHVPVGYSSLVLLPLAIHFTCFRFYLFEICIFICLWLSANTLSTYMPFMCLASSLSILSSSVISAALYYKTFLVLCLKSIPLCIYTIYTISLTYHTLEVELKFYCEWSLNKRGGCWRIISRLIVMTLELLPTVRLHNNMTVLFSILDETPCFFYNGNINLHLHQLYVKIPFLNTHAINWCHL